MVYIRFQNFYLIMINNKLTDIIKRIYAWNSGTHSVYYKFSFYIWLVFSSLNYLYDNKRIKFIKYFSNNFYFKNKEVPFNLMFYPQEIGDILKNIDSDLDRVLDIGGNIGQFSVTLGYFLPNCKIDIFEPLPESYNLLLSNTRPFDNFNVYQYAVGEEGTNYLYYSPSRTVNASLLKGNENYRVKHIDIQRVNVKTVSNIASYTQNSTYDLIKIDVEGYEATVLKNLNNISTKYLYIEISGTARNKDYKHSSFFELIKRTFGDYDVVYITDHSKYKFEVLLKILN